MSCLHRVLFGSRKQLSAFQFIVYAERGFLFVALNTFCFLALPSVGVYFHAESRAARLVLGVARGRVEP